MATKIMRKSDGTPDYRFSANQKNKRGAATKTRAQTKGRTTNLRGQSRGR